MSAHRLTRILPVVGLCLLAGACGNTTEEKAASGGLGGIAAGAVVGGPVGAVVGGVAGAGAGTAAQKIEQDNKGSGTKGSGTKGSGSAY